ncbi:imelysin family protein [Pusillimonas minor]|uniref:Imelysin family protein n=1 Tax=Pusillimonas minor TaxID=2697024 RepID=A0A842HKC4_9BURK|nr:imelysin family protein [Pusillimonas minor]MBC2768736.1 imelysin family protein [Pusillimonas minor]
MQRSHVVDNNQVGQRWAEAYIQPALARFTQAANQLAIEIKGACEVPGSKSGDRLAEAFNSMVTAWSRILFLRFGPLVEANRYERISFWPDVRNVSLRQLPKVIAQYKSGQAPDLSAQSVAVQGLPALEYVLYRDGGVLQAGASAASADKAMQAQCDYAVAVAHNLTNTGKQLEHAWSLQGGYGGAFVQPRPAAAYRSTEEVLSEGIKAMSTGLQFISDIQIKPALTSDNVKLLPYWRSDQTIAALRAGMAGVREFMQVGQLSLGDQAWAGQQFLAELKRAETLLQGPEDLQAVVLILDNARALLVQDIAPAAGVALGFNALDGD